MAVIARGQVTIATVENGADGKTGVAVVYRGDFSSMAIYYNNTVRRDVVKYNDNYYIYKGTNGIRNSWKSSNWDDFGGQYDSVATELLLAENANLGGFIFHGGKLISQKGTIDGVESTDYGNADFIPYITLDGTNGLSQIYNGEFFGSVRTLFYPVDETNCQYLGDGRYKVTDKTNLTIDYVVYEGTPNIVLPNNKAFLGKTVNINNPCRPPFTKTDLMFTNSSIVSTESGEGIFYSPFLGSLDQLDTSQYVNHAYQIEFISGMLSFLCVPRKHSVDSDDVSWVCTNYPFSNNETTSGGSGSGDVKASGTMTSGYLIVGGGAKTVYASSFKPSATFVNSISSLPSGKAVADYVAGKTVQTDDTEFTSTGIILGNGNKKIRDSKIAFEQSLSGSSLKVPSSYAVKKYVDAQSSGGGTEWYNIYNLKGTGGKLYTVVENLSSIMTHNPNNYRIVLLKFRKQHADGRRWAMPMFIYELYNQGSCASLPPNAIAENNTWWPVGNNPTPWFATTGAVLANVISLGERLTGDSSKRSWKNTRNKKMKIGVAVYKQTGKGKIGWHRCSNIAFVELYKQDTAGKYQVNMML